MQSKPCPKCSAGKDKCCGECGEWEVGSRKTKLPEDVKKQTTKKAAIGSLMNTMGRVGGNQKKMKPMAISADALSAKPAPQPQLGAQTNNRFLQQADSLRSKVAENSVDTPEQLVAYYPDGTKRASHIDVSPYITSTYVQSLPYRRGVSTEQLYTKIASLESMLTKTVPGLFKALPKQYSEPIAGAVQAIKDKYAPATQSPAFSEGISRLGTLFSDLGTKLKDIKPSPATVSRLSMLQRPQSQASPVPAQQPANQAAGGATFNSARYTSKPSGDVSTKHKELTKAPETLGGLGGLQKTPGAYSSPEEYTAVARKSDLDANFGKANLGADSKPVSPEKTYNDVATYLLNTNASDLAGMPQQHRAAYDALPADQRKQLTDIMENNAIVNAAMRQDSGYASPLGDAGLDRGVLSAAETANDLTTLPRSALAGVGLGSKDKLVPNIDATKRVIETADAIKNIKGEIANLNASMRNRQKADPNYFGSAEYAADSKKLVELIAAQREGASSIANRKIVLPNGKELSLDTTAADPMALFDPNKGKWDKGIDTLGSVFSAIMPQVTAARGLARFGLNAADVNNADIYADLGSLLTPTPSGIAKAYSAITSPRQTLDALNKFVSTARSAPKMTALNLAGKGAWNAAKSRPAAALPLIEELRANSRQQPTAEPVATIAQAPVDTIPQFPVIPPEELMPAAKPTNVPTAAADAPVPQPVAVPAKGLTDLQRYLLSAGVSLPVALALTQYMNSDNDEEAAAQ